MRTTWKRIRYRLEWLALKSATKFVPLLSRKACYRLALLLGSLGAMLDRRGRRVALSNLRVAFGDEISSERRAQIVRESCQHFSHTMLDFFWSILSLIGSSSKRERPTRPISKAKAFTSPFVARTNIESEVGSQKTAVSSSPRRLRPLAGRTSDINWLRLIAGR